MGRAEGNFTVKLAPVSGEGDDYPRMSLAKEFVSGAMLGKSAGQMMTGGVAEHGSRVYVALETFTGKVDGREGSFIMAHRGTMTKEDKKLSIIVVPSSGTGQLEGIAGTCDIDVAEDGTHTYVLEYTLPTNKQ